MTTRYVSRFFYVISLSAIFFASTLVEARPSKVKDCPGAVILAGDGVLINRPPPFSICNPSA